MRRETVKRSVCKHCKSLAQRKTSTTDFGMPRIWLTDLSLQRCPFVPNWQQHLLLLPPSEMESHDCTKQKRTNPEGMLIEQNDFLPKVFNC